MKICFAADCNSACCVECGRTRGLILRHSFVTAGCSIQDELFGSFEQLLALADEKGATYDRYILLCIAVLSYIIGQWGFHVLTTSVLCRFVLENSGVAEPQNIRDQFNDGIAAGTLSPAHKEAEFDLSSMAWSYIPGHTISRTLCMFSHLKPHSG